MTEISSDQRKPCVFPFKLQEGATDDQNSCTNLFDRDGKYWCSTKVSTIQSYRHQLDSNHIPSSQIFHHFNENVSKLFQMMPLVH